MFKIEWEKTQSRIKIESSVVAQMLQQAFPERSDYAFNQISGGCANLNYKVTFFDHSEPLLLRIYIRDPESAYREQHIAELFANQRDRVPVPKTFFVGDCEGYRYAIIEYIFGVPLRDVLLHYGQAEWIDTMKDVGTMLAAVGKMDFHVAGLFDADLNVVKPFVSEEMSEEVYAILHDPVAAGYLGDERAEKIHQVYSTHVALIPDASHHHLVHGDFDPSNILVDKVQHRWQITALLDWEFTFSGSRLWDVSNMLRYAHCMPAVFQESFIEGLQEEGIVLPDQWEKTTHMLSLISLVEAVARGNPQESPLQYSDMYQLIDYQIQQLST